MRHLVALALVIGIAGPAAHAQPSAQIRIPATLDRAAAVASRDRALAWLVARQRPDGSWGRGVITGLIDSGYSVASFYDWKVAASALAIMALRRCPQTPARRAALDRAVGWFTRSRLPRRGSDWDNDTMWAVLCGIVTLVEVADDPRFATERWRGPVAARGAALVRMLVRNQIPTGGWAYYDDPPYSRRPKWGTSFSTALVLPSLQRARALGWLADGHVLRRGLAYVKRCRLPNGAYEYSLNPIPRAPMGEHINQVKGSLARIQVCNWALRRCGDAQTTRDRIRSGLTQMLRHHRFLDVARMRPIPHEAYYANAGYFYFFGHYYAAEAIELLPANERERWHAALRPHIVKTQRKDGGFCDYLGQDYLVVAGTAYAALALQLGS